MQNRATSFFVLGLSLIATISILPVLVPARSSPQATGAGARGAASLVLQGKSLDEIKQQLGETTPAPAGGRGPRFASFTEVVYQELNKK